MALETATYIDGLNASNPVASDAISTADDHLRLIKSTIKATFPNITAPVTKTAAEINGLAPLASPTFTGTPAAPTAASGTNTTQLATTAFVRAAILESVYPVGSIYTNASNNTNPGTLLGFGTWTAFGAGRVMVGFNASDPLFDTAEETGGSKDATVVAHSHTASSTSSVSDPGHAHSITTNDGNFQAPTNNTAKRATDGLFGAFNSASNTTGISVSTSTTVNSTGSSGTNANLQPYITVYMWKRTA
jgi:hypothetical protein